MKQAIAGLLILFSGLCLAVQPGSGAGVDPTGQVFFSFSLQDAPKNNWRPRVGLRLGSNRSPTLDWEKPAFFDTAITLQIEPNGETNLSLAGMDFGIDGDLSLFRRLDPAGTPNDTASFAAFDDLLPDRLPLNLIAPASGGTSTAAPAAHRDTARVTPAIANTTPHGNASDRWAFKQIAYRNGDARRGASNVSQRANVARAALRLPKDRATEVWRFRAHHPVASTEPPRAIRQSAAFTTRSQPKINRVQARQLAARAALPKPLPAPRRGDGKAPTRQALHGSARTEELLIPPAARRQWALRPVAPKPAKPRRSALSISLQQDTRR